VLPELDPLIHAQARLRLITVLAGAPPGRQVAFPQLQEALQMTAGNLSTHLRRLEEADCIAVTKAYRDRTPVTWVSVTPTGRARLERYQADLRAYLDDLPIDDLLGTEEPT
jgi:DNA-binding MarR family transcriptional regulator